MAAKTAGAALSLTQTDGTVAFVMRLEAAASAAAPRESLAIEAAAAGFPPGLAIYCIDDSEAARRLLRHNLLAHAQTDRVRVFGENEGEVAEFTQAVLQHGDITILDQHLEYGGDANILGSDIVADLRAQGYRGLVCMRSGNTADEDVALYQAAGAQCVFGKEVSMKRMIARMKVAYNEHCRRHATLVIEDIDSARSSGVEP